MLKRGLCLTYTLLCDKLCIFNWYCIYIYIYCIYKCKEIKTIVIRLSIPVRLLWNFEIK